MPLALCQYGGSGTRADPFRPSGVDGMSDWSSLDFRPDPTQQAGFCVVWHDTDTPTGALRVLGAARDDKPGAVVRALLANRLGVNLTTTTLGDLLGEIMLHRGLLPSLGRHQVWCGRAEPWFDVPVIAGGSTLASDNFNRANETPIASPWHQTPNPGGFTRDVNLSSNQAVTSNDLDTLWYWDDTVVSWPNDQWAQAALTPGGNSSGSGCGPAIRVNKSSGKNCYMMTLDTGGHVDFDKWVSDSYTTIWARSVTYSAGATGYIEAQGTTLIAKYNGSAIGASSTDSSLSSGYPGIWYSSGVTSGKWDDWSAGDFASGGTNASVAAEVATASAAAPVPTVSGVNDQALTAEEATATAAALVPTIAAKVNAALTADVSTAAAAALEPTVTSVEQAAITADLAAADASAMDPTVVGVQNAAVTADVATADAAAPIPTVAIVDNVAIVDEVATADAAAPSPTVVAIQVVAVIADLATSDAAAPIPTLVAVEQAAITADVASADAGAPVPTVTAQVDATVTADVSTADAAALEPTVTGVEIATITADVATAAAVAPEPIVETGGNKTVQSVAATASAAAPIPTVVGVENAAITADVATADAVAPIPTVSTGVQVHVTAEVATAAAAAPIPAVSAVANASVTAEVATAAADAPIPTVTTIGAISVVVVAEVATAGAAALIPAISVPVPPSPPVVITGGRGAWRPPPRRDLWPELRRRRPYRWPEEEKKYEPEIFIPPPPVYVDVRDIINVARGSKHLEDILLDDAFWRAQREIIFTAVRPLFLAAWIKGSLAALAEVKRAQGTREVVATVGQRLDSAVALMVRDQPRAVRAKLAADDTFWREQERTMATAIRAVGFRADPLPMDIERINTAAPEAIDLYMSDWWDGLMPRIRDELRTAIASAHREGKGPSFVADLIERFFGRPRAEMIAVTEMTNVIGAASQAQYAAQGLGQWQWATAEDDRVCPICGELDGQIFPMSTAFAAAHSRCRCWNLPVVD